MIVPVLKGYCHLVRYLVRVIGHTVPFLLPLLAGIVAFEVFARYVLNSPTIWVYDTSLFLFGYISALGGAYAQQRKSHINVDIIYLKVPKYVRSIFNLITIILAVGFLILLAKLSFEKFTESLQFNYRTKSEWAPEVYHFWLMMTVAAVIFIAEYSAEFIENLFYLFTRKALFSEQELAAEKEHATLLSVLRSLHLDGFSLKNQAPNEPDNYLDYDEVMEKHQQEIDLEHEEKRAKHQGKKGSNHAD